MPRMDEQRYYDELVGLCYGCVLDETAWQNLLHRLAQSTGRQQGALLFWNRRNPAGQVSNCYQLDPKAAEAYNSYYCNLDPTRTFMVDRTVGDWYHDTRELGPERIRRDPYYQEYQLPFGMRSVSCVKLRKGVEAEVFLSLVINKDARQATECQQRLLKRLTPHLVKAAQLAGKIDSLELELTTRDLLLDRHCTPLWLLDGHGRVLYCNQQAGRSLGQSGFALYENFGRLHCKNQDTRLQQLIRQAANKSGVNLAGWLRLSPPHTQDVLITPVPADAPFNRFQQPLALLALLERQAPSSLLAELFELTPAEQRLAELLALGLTPECCAGNLGVSINTVRTQLRALFRKTQTERQVELVGLIGRLHS